MCMGGTKPDIQKGPPAQSTPFVAVGFNHREMPMSVCQGIAWGAPCLEQAKTLLDAGPEALPTVMGGSW